MTLPFDKGRCPKCQGKMSYGKAIEETWIGTADFPGQEVVTMSPGGPGKLIICWKCKDCGYSVTTGKQDAI